jgi:hypothetical protein
LEFIGSSKSPEKCGAVVVILARRVCGSGVGILIGVAAFDAANDAGVDGGADGLNSSLVLAIYSTQVSVGLGTIGSAGDVGRVSSSSVYNGDEILLGSDDESDESVVLVATLMKRPLASLVRCDVALLRDVVVRVLACYSACSFVRVGLNHPLVTKMEWAKLLI